MIKQKASGLIGKCLLVGSLALGVSSCWMPEPGTPEYIAWKQKKELEQRKYLASIGHPVVGTPEYYEKLRRDREKAEKQRRYEEVMAEIREDARQRNKELIDKLGRNLFLGLGTDIIGYEYRRQREK